METVTKRRENIGRYECLSFSDKARLHLDGYVKKLPGFGFPRMQGLRLLSHYTRGEFKCGVRSEVSGFAGIPREQTDG
jgi:hypothetical protein